MVKTFFSYENGIASAYHLGIEGWDGFDQIIDFITNRYDTKILSKENKSFHRHCNLKINNLEFDLYHDDLFGNSITSISKSGNSLVKEIANNLENIPSTHSPKYSKNNKKEV